MKISLKLLAAGVVTVLVAVASVVPFSGTQNVPTVSAASSDYFLKLEGIDEEIAIESFSWGVSSPRDVATGQSSGKRQYQPLIIRKSIDKSTPLLFRKAGDSKTKGHVTLIRRTDGKEDYRVSFFDVFISSFVQAGDVNGDGFEDVSFTYQKIEL